jgi:hypothetical protein
MQADGTFMATIRYRKAGTLMCSAGKQTGKKGQQLHPALRQLPAFCL